MCKRFCFPIVLSIHIRVPVCTATIDQPVDGHMDCLPEELLGNSCCASLLDDDYDDARSFNTLAVLGASFIVT